MSEPDCHKLRSWYILVLVYQVLRICAGAECPSVSSLQQDSGQEQLKQHYCCCCWCCLVLNRMPGCYLLTADPTAVTILDVGTLARSTKSKGIGVVVSARCTNTKLRIVERKHSLCRRTRCCFHCILLTAPNASPYHSITPITSCGY